MMEWPGGGEPGPRLLFSTTLCGMRGADTRTTNSSDLDKLMGLRLALIRLCFGIEPVGLAKYSMGYRN